MAGKKSSTSKSKARTPARSAKRSGAAKPKARAAAPAAKRSGAAKPKARAPVPALKGTADTKWTVTGVSPRTQAAVRKAAHKEGVPLGAWVDRTLHAAATDTIKGGTPFLALPPDLLSTIGEIGRKLESIEEQLESQASRFSVPVERIGHAADDFRHRAGEMLDQMQKSSSSVMDSVMEHTDSTVDQIKEISNTTIKRIREATDAAIENARQVAGSGRDDKAGKKPGAKR